mgnify:CR=1 FL=1
MRNVLLASLLAGLIVMLVVGGKSISAGSPASQASQMEVGEEPRGNALRRAAQGAGRSLQEGQVVGVARVIVGRAYATAMFQAGEQRDTFVERISQLVAAKQIEWQNGRSPGVYEADYLIQLNTLFDLNAAPAYAQLRPADLSRARVDLWMNVPRISTGPLRSEVKVGSRLFSATMSPLEAAAVTDWLIHAKTTNPEFVRTAEEARQARSQGTLPEVRSAPSLVSEPKTEEVYGRISLAVQRKLSSQSAVLEQVERLLGVRRGE